MYNYKYKEEADKIIFCLRFLKIESRKYGKEQEYFNINAISNGLKECCNLSLSNKRITSMLRFLISAKKVEALDKKDITGLNVYMLR